MDNQLTEAVKRAKNGDRNAIGEIYTLTAKPVYFTALKITGNPSDAEDITQDVFLTAMRKLPELKDEQAFPKWIKVIAANLSKNFVMKKKPVVFDTDEEELRVINSIPEVAEDFLPEDYADKKEGCRLVMEIIDALPEKQRVVVIMYYFDEMSVTEIAEAMNTNNHTIKSRLDYARQKIKAAVEDLEKKGTKLYAAVPIPVLTQILYKESESLPLPQTVLPKLEKALNEPPVQPVNQVVYNPAPITAKAAGGFFTTVAGKVTIAVIAVAGAAAVTAGALAVAFIGREPEETTSNSDYAIIVEDTTEVTTELTTEATTEVTTEEITTEPLADVPPEMSGEVTLGAAVPFTKEQIVGGYNNTLIIKDENNRYILYRTDGTKLSDVEYTSLNSDFSAEGYVSLGLYNLADGTSSNSVLDENGNVVYENAIAYCNGILVQKEPLGVKHYEERQGVFEGENYCRIIITDTKTGEVLFTDEDTDDVWSIMSAMSVFSPYDDGFYSVVYTNKYPSYYMNVNIVSRDYPVLNLNERLGKIYGKEVALLGWNINSYGYISVRISDDSSPAGICGLYDINTDTFTETEELPALPHNPISEYGFDWQYDHTSETYMLSDLDGNVLLDNLSYFDYTEAAGLYIICKDGKWGYLNGETKETVYYDDATRFVNGCAFVTVDGMGHFVNEKLEVISSDIPSTSASFIDKSNNLIYLEKYDAVYAVNFPAAEVAE